jgi:hypothetical protein
VQERQPRQCANERGKPKVERAPPERSTIQRSRRAGCV